MMASSLLSEIGLWGAMSYFSALLVQRHGLSIDAVGWAFLAIGVITFAANIVAQGPAGKRPRPLMIGCRLWCALCLGVAFGLPVSWLVSLGFVLLASPAFSMENLATTLVLNASSPAGRATTLTLRSAAVCIGTAVGGALGGGALAVGGYGALGVLSFVVLLVSTAVAWWSRAGAPSTSGQRSTRPALGRERVRADQRRAAVHAMHSPVTYRAASERGTARRWRGPPAPSARTWGLGPGASRGTQSPRDHGG